MKKIKFWNIPKYIKSLEFDGDKTDTRLLDEGGFSWGAKSEKLYKMAEKELDKIHFVGNGWEIYASYDVSGYSYWMKNMEEVNHLYLTVSFDGESIEVAELGKLRDDLFAAKCMCNTFAQRYDYDPSPYNKPILTK